MRQECMIEGCGKDAVDYLAFPAEHVLDPPGAPGEIARLYLCAEHWDAEARIRKAVRES